MKLKIYQRNKCNFKIEKKEILIVDFGSQVTKLIARKIRELGVYSEVITPKEINKLKDYNKVKGIILSGGPSSVTGKNLKVFQKDYFSLKIPILGICYGLQLIAKLFGEKLNLQKKKESSEELTCIKKKNSLLTKNFFKPKKIVWMSHEDAVVKLPKFKSVEYTKNSKLTIIENTKEKIYGVQFHPEVTHTENGITNN